MTRPTDIDALHGVTLLDRTGDKIGKIDEIYDDTVSGQPEWALVQTGLFGTKRTFVPIDDVSREGDAVRVPFEKAQVKDAPRIDVEDRLSDADERRLYQHYGREWDTPARGESGRYTTGREEERGPGRDVSGPTTDSAMTRSEEELRVGSARQERGRARLRKHVVTEHVQKTVPVQREELRVEREPITDANVEAATSGPAISEEEHEVILHEEEPVVEKKAVPKERVRLDTETVTGEAEIQEEVRKERIDVDEEGGRNR